MSHRAARLYISILTLADDYGRYDGRPSVLWAETFAVWNECNPQESAVNSPQVAADCLQLAAAGLVAFYEVSGRRYLQVTQWQERARGKSKWPDPPPQLDSNSPQVDSNLTATCGEILPPSPLASALSHEPAPAPSVEPPPGFPRSEEEAVAMADKVGVPPHFARLKYDGSVGTGFTNWRGLTVRSFSHWIKAEWTRAEHGEKDANGKPAAPDNFWKNTKELELIDKEIKTICDRSSADAFGMKLGDKDKPNYAKLVKRRKELRKELNLTS